MRVWAILIAEKLVVFATLYYGAVTNDINTIGILDG
jgi:hypothetical protein